MNKKILAFHLYNDYSGSPKVLNTVLCGLRNRGYKIDLFTSVGGVLDGLSEDGVNIHHFYYYYSRCVIANIFRIAWAQLRMFIYGLYYSRNASVFYINTILPLGAAIAAKICKKPIVYHYHENAFIKSKVYRFLARRMEALADTIICVSEFQRSYLTRQDSVCTIPNALPKELLRRLRPNIETSFLLKTILFIGSLKEYKGVSDFIQLANMLPQYSFVMVVNDSQDAINQYLSLYRISIPHNLTIYPKQKDIAPYYNSATVTVNLSNKELFIETFGLTVIESFGAGLPAIVPTIGGIAEIVVDGYNGYKIDVQNLPDIAKKIDEMCSEKDLYMRLATNAIVSSQRFSEQKMLDKIEAVISKFIDRR